MSFDACAHRDRWLDQVPEYGDEHEVGIDFNDAPATALVTLANGVIHVDGLLHGGLYLDADDLSDSAQQRIAELARAALLREAAE
ncbi:MAG: hypothetical protein ABS84_14735 [Rubrivivax sp. SCN 71-131]|nr:MAG: hypothetical protein ABS84_14735 [Rubrivivax sp. SCN 71-131]